MASTCRYRMVALVEQMLALHKQLPESRQASRENRPAAAHRGHGRADRRAGLRALRADRGGDQDSGGEHYLMMERIKSMCV